MTWRRCGGMLLLAGATACGGGGGGTGGPDVLQGIYAQVAIGGSSGTLEQMFAAFGRMDLDGAGHGVSVLLQNLNGLVYPLQDPELTYALQGGGSLEIGGSTSAGGITADGRAGLLTSEEGAPYASLFFRRGQGTTADDLSGPYHWGELGYVVTTSNHATSGGDADFSNPLGVSVSGDFLNVEGTFPATIWLDEGYLVFPDGSLRITNHGGVTWEGGISEDLEVLAVGGGNENGDPVSMRVYVQHAAGATAAILSGAYWVGGFTKDADPGTAMRVPFGTAVFDGVGGVEFDVAVNEDGVAGPPATFTGTYAVLGDGSLTVAAPVVLEGGVSPSGAFAFAVGGTALGDDPALLLFVRK